MNQLKLKHGLDEVPPFGELILIGLQWFAIAVPIVIIVGKIVAGLHFDDAAAQIIYIQKIFFLSGIALLAQLFWGHRLPLITGPATILLVAIISGGAGSFGSVYTAISIGGLILFLLNAAGLFGYLSKLFTAPVVATILMLVAFTLAPMIIDLIVSSNAPGQALADLCFSLVLLLALFFVSSRLSGFWKSTLILWALLAGTILYILIFPHNIMEAGTAAKGAFGGFFQNMNFKPVFEPGVIIAFLVCFLALSINDLGSIYSVGGMLKTEQMASRIRWGLSFTGILNFVSGLLGVIGLVNFSLSPGVIASTKSASRYTLVPAGILLVGVSFIPRAIAFMGAVPPVVIGSVLLYIMCSQLGAGLIMALDSPGGFSFERSLVIGLPLMLSIIISFLPEGTTAAFPVIFRPILGNGFVVGVLSVLIMEHLIFKRVRS